MTWRTARSLDVLLAECNAAAPKRSTASDGSIGDAAHASRDSDHNPWVQHGGQGIVRARDITHDPADGLDCNVLADAAGDLLGKHPALGAGAYVIWNRRIKSTDRLSEGWRPYAGSNPHDKHCHVSVALAASGFDSTKPWNIFGPKEPVLNDVEKGRAAIDRARRELSEAVEHFKASTGREVVQKSVPTLKEHRAALTILLGKLPKR